MDNAPTAPALASLDLATRFDKVIAVAGNYGRAGQAWDQSLERLWEALQRDTTTQAEVTFRLGAGQVEGAEYHSTGADVHALGIYALWRDGVRDVTFLRGVQRAEMDACLRILARPASILRHTLAGRERESIDPRVWRGGATDEDTVTRLRVEPLPHVRFRTIDPYEQVSADVHAAVAATVGPLRADSLIGVRAAVGAGVEPVRVLELPRPDEGGRAAWRASAASADEHHLERILTWVDHRMRSGVEAAETVATAWVDALDIASGAGAWGALSLAVDLLGRGAPPEVTRAIRGGLMDKERSLRFGAAVAAAPPRMAWEVATWLAWAPASILDAASTAMVARHDPEQADAFVHACRDASPPVPAGRLLAAWATARPDAALWAVKYLHAQHTGEHHTGEMLRRALSHPDPQVQTAALLGLGGDTAPETRAALAASLGGKRRDMLAHALEELVAMGDDEARAVVNARVRAPDLDALPATARIMILDALVRLGGEDARAWCRGVLGRRGWFEPREVKERQAELVQVLKAVKNDFARELTAEAGR